MINDVASYYGISEAPHGGPGWSGWGRTHSRLGLLEMVQVKYVDVDRLPRFAKPWWYGYSEDFAAAAGSMVEALFAPSWKRRLRAMRRQAWRSRPDFAASPDLNRDILMRMKRGAN